MTTPRYPTVAGCECPGCSPSATTPGHWDGWRGQNPGKLSDYFPGRRPLRVSATEPELVDDEPEPDDEPS